MAKLCPKSVTAPPAQLRTGMFRPPSHRAVLAFPAAALLFLLPCSQAQTTGNMRAAQASTPSVVWTSANPSAAAATNGSAPGGPVSVDKLAGNDLLEIMVPYCPELSHTFRVSADGRLSLPLLKQQIPVAGLDPAAAAARIGKALNDEGVMNEPVVSLSVLESRSRPVSVLGAVNHPLTFQVNGPVTLSDALAQAGGLAPTAGPLVIVSREAVDADGRPTRSVTSIPVVKLMNSSDGEINLRLSGNEEIRVPEAGKIFVTGDVRHPGMFPMQNDTDTTVLKALALSEGLAPFPSSIAYIYRRRPDAGQSAGPSSVQDARGGASQDRTEIKVPLARIIARKDADVALQPDDVLYVPENGGKKMTSRVLSQIVGFGQTAGTGVLIYH